MQWDATVRQLLSHSAGIVALDEPAPTSAFYDWDGLCERLARQQPSWPPGTAVGESALLFGHLVGELVRRVDGRTVGTVLREEIARPLDLDLHIGVPAAELAASPTSSRRRASRTGSGGPLRDAVLANPPGATDPAVVNSAAWRQAEIPAVNAHATARAVAGFFAAVAGGRVLPAELVTELSRVQAAGVDRVLGGPARWGLGVAIEPDGWGMGGIGGSLGWWSDEAGYALGFVTAHLDTHDRSARIENALRGCSGPATARRLTQPRCRLPLDGAFPLSESLSWFLPVWRRTLRGWSPDPPTQAPPPSSRPTSRANAPRH